MLPGHLVTGCVAVAYLSLYRQQEAAWNTYHDCRFPKNNSLFKFNIIHKKSQKMESKYFILKVLLIGLAAFFIRYSFYLTRGKLEKKKYFIVLGICVLVIFGYFVYLRFLTP